MHACSQDWLGVRQEPKSKRNARISQHYLAALTAVFEEFQTAGLLV